MATVRIDCTRKKTIDDFIGKEIKFQGSNYLVALTLNKQYTNLEKVCPYVLKVKKEPNEVIIMTYLGSNSGKEPIPFFQMKT